MLVSKGVTLGGAVNGISTVELGVTSSEAEVVGNVLTADVLTAGSEIPAVPFVRGIELVGKGISEVMRPVEDGGSSDAGIPVGIEEGTSETEMPVDIELSVGTTTPLVPEGAVVISVPEAVADGGNTPEVVIASVVGTAVSRVELPASVVGVGVSLVGTPASLVGTTEEDSTPVVGRAESDDAILDTMLSIGIGAVPVGRTV